jgi:DNA adenine methylase
MFVSSLRDADEIHVSEKIPHLSGGGQGLNRVCVGSRGQFIQDWFAGLRARLRDVRVTCGSWERLLSPAVTWRNGTTAIVLDPPYSEGELTYAVGAATHISAQVRAWCLENGEDERLRIAFCGYDGEDSHKQVDLPGWSSVPWVAKGGYGGQRKDEENTNRFRERIWFSPHCLAPSKAGKDWD